MFIKLTKPDNSPIWINATFVVTVEPRRGGGSTVVPVGDGLDYDVREPPERVLALLGDAPQPAVIPIPTSDALVKTPVGMPVESVSQLVAEARPTPPPAPAAAAAEPPAAEATAAAEVPAETTPAPEEPASADVFSETPAKKPAKRTRKAASTTAAKKPRTRKAKKPPLPLPDDQVERLKKMGPKSVKKLQNTLFTQFRIGDVATAVEALVANGVFSLDGDRVIWPAPEPAAAPVAEPVVEG